MNQHEWHYIANYANVPLRIYSLTRPNYDLALLCCCRKTVSGIYHIYSFRSRLVLQTRVILAMKKQSLIFKINTVL